MTRPQILFVVAHLPVPVRGGSSQRSNVLLEALQSFADVELAPIGPQGIRYLLEDHGYRVAAVLPPDPSALWWRIASILFPGRVRYRPRRAAADVVQELWGSGRYSAVVGRYLGPSARAGLHELPVAFVDIDDLESQKLQSWGDSGRLGRWAAFLPQLMASRMLKVEREVASSLSQAWLSAEEDTDRLSGVNTGVIPNIPFYEPRLAGASPEHGTILFVASLDYRVNVSALVRFASVVWPEMRKRHQQAVLRVIGGGLSAKIKSELEKIAGVEIAGFVDDLEAEYRRALFSVVPIWEGGGTKIKILESLAFDRTCVVALPSLRGYGDSLRDGEVLLKASDESEFLRAMETLYVDATLRHKLEERGAQAVTEGYSRDVVSQRLQNSIMATLRNRT